MSGEWCGVRGVHAVDNLSTWVHAYLPHIFPKCSKVVLLFLYHTQHHKSRGKYAHIMHRISLTGDKK